MSALLFYGCATMENSAPTPTAPNTVIKSKLGAEDINTRCHNFLLANGWMKKRELLNNELLDCGGDWGGLYRKGDKYILLHICGMPAPGREKLIIFLYVKTTEAELFSETTPTQLLESL